MAELREIKFRLRDRHNKIVGYEKWYPGEWYYDNNANMHPDSGYWRASPCWLYSVDNERWTPNYIHHRHKDQCTGLPDKNGKEIYGGDILKHTRYGEHNYEVTWNNEAGGLFIGSMNLTKACEPSCEVIGNIWEDSGLLEVKN